MSGPAARRAPGLIEDAKEVLLKLFDADAEYSADTLEGIYDELEKVSLDYVRKEYLEEGDERELGVATPLITGGIVDSFSMVSLKRFLEKKYVIRIPDAEATPAAFDSVRAIAALVEKLRGAPATA